MKWIKVAIGAVIAVLSIGIIATTVYKMTQPREVIREVSFEIVPSEGKYYPLSIYNEILEYAVVDEENDVINIVESYINEISEIIRVNIGPNGELISFTIDWIFIDSFIHPDGNWFDNVGSLPDNTNIKLVFTPITQPPQLTGISATLILLIPTVCAGGVLLYFYKSFKKD